MKQKIINELTNKKIVILGFGKEGKSTYNFIKTNVKYDALAIADKNDKIKESIFDEKVILHLGHDYIKHLDQYDVIIKTPGISLNGYKNKTSAKITSQTELFIKYGRNRTIGVTGTKGKSTTASLIYLILKLAKKRAVLIGNIGRPAFEILNEEKNIDFFVYELSAHQLEYLNDSPHIAIILNIFEEHLDHFNTIENYKNAKKNIAKYQTNKDFFISNEELFNETEYINSKKIAISQAEDASDNYTTRVKNKITSNVDNKILSVQLPEKMRLIGEHNIYNSMVAITVSNILNIQKSIIEEALLLFEPLPHRLQDIGTFNGIRYINDSISTIPEATIKAIETINNVGTVLIGGKDRKISYLILEEYIKEHKDIKFILMYESGKRIYKNIKKLENTTYVPDLKTAIITAKAITEKGKTCILSPAAASFGHFIDFEDRGEKFKKYVIKTIN